MSKESVVSDQRLRNKLKSVFELTQQNPIPWKKINKQMQNLLEEFKTSDLAKSAWAILLAQQGQASEALQVVDDIAQHLGILKLDETSSVGSSGSHLPDVSTITNTNESNSNVIFEDTSTQILHDIATNQSSSSGSLTLNNILTCYKLLKRSDKIQSFYQSAWNKCIALNNKTLAKQFGLGLFGSLLRSRDWTTARSHTLNLFRTYNETRYFMWHLVTVVLSVPTDASLHTLSQREIATLQVAEGLFTKNLLTPGKVTTQQEILWYLKLLQRLGRYQQALELLQRDSVSKFFPISSQRETLYAQILAEYAISTSTTSTKEDSVQRVTLLRDSIAAYTKLLRTVDADEWSYYRTLFTLARTLNTSEVWTQLHTLFSELADSHKSKRGPVLAQLEHTLHRIELDSTNVGIHLQTLVDQVIEYVRRFGDRVCCFRDIRSAVRVLYRHQRLPLVVNRLDEVLINESLTTTSSVLRRTCCEQLRYATYYTPSDHSRSEVIPSQEDSTRNLKRCWSFYCDSLTHISQTLQSSERHCGDDLLLLCALLIPRVDPSLKGHLKSIALLEFGLQHSPYNFQFTLALLECHRRLGAAQTMYSLLRSVDVKQIQCDTLAYLLLPHLVDFGAYHEAELFIQQLLTFHNDNKKTTPDLLFSAFQYGSYCKIPEILQFETRLSKSTALAWAQTLQFTMNFALHAHTLSDTLTLLSSFEGLDILPNEKTMSEVWCNDDVTVPDSWDLNLNNPSSETYFSQHRQRVMRTATDNESVNHTSSLALLVPQLQLLLLRITHLRTLRALASLSTTTTTTTTTKTLNIFTSELKTLSDLLVSLHFSPSSDSPDFYSPPSTSSFSLTSFNSLLWRIVYFSLHLTLTSRVLSDGLISSTSRPDVLILFENTEKDLTALTSFLNVCSNFLQFGSHLSSSPTPHLEFPDWLHNSQFFLSLVCSTILLSLQFISSHFPVRLKRVSDEVKRKHSEMRNNLKNVLSTCQQHIKTLQGVIENLRGSGLNAASLGLQIDMKEIFWLQETSLPNSSVSLQQNFQQLYQKSLDRLIGSYRDSLSQLHELCKVQLTTLQNTILK